jgi:hypothetical protein
MEGQAVGSLTMALYEFGKCVAVTTFCDGA